jgi:hypothetical protein
VSCGNESPARTGRSRDDCGDRDCQLLGGFSDLVRRPDNGQEAGNDVSHIWYSKANMA